MFVKEILKRQSGVITRQQALAEGLSKSAITRTIKVGTWEPVLPRVFVASNYELTDQAWTRAVALWAGERATVSGLAAAWWHELIPNAPSVIEVTVPARQRLPPHPGILLRRRDLTNLDRVETRHLWVTALPLTVLEAAVTLGAEGTQLLDRALQRRVRFETVLRAHSRNLGRHGSAAASKLLTSAADRAASQAERLMIKLLRGAGLDGWVRGHWLAGFELDFAFPGRRIAIEVDGWAWHWDVDRFRGDRRRQNVLELAGWTVLRFTWHDLTHRPVDVIAQINDALARTTHWPDVVT